MAIKKLFTFGNIKRTKLVAKVDTDPGDTKPGKKGMIIGNLQDSPTGVGVRVTFDDAGNVVARVLMDQLPVIGLSHVHSFASTLVGSLDVGRSLVKPGRPTGHAAATEDPKGTSTADPHLSPQSCLSNAPVDVSTVADAPASPESLEAELASNVIALGPVSLSEDFKESSAVVPPHGVHQSSSISQLATEESVPEHGSSVNSPTSESSAPISEGSTLVSVDPPSSVEIPAKTALIASLEDVCATLLDVSTGDELVVTHQDLANEDSSAPQVQADINPFDTGTTTFSASDKDPAGLTLTSSDVSAKEITLSSVSYLSVSSPRSAKVSIDSTAPAPLQVQAIISASTPAISSALAAPIYSLATADFRIGMSLGEGGQGSVSLVAYRANARLYALKAIKKRTENAHRRSENAWVFQEQDIMRRLARGMSGCPFFVELRASFEDERNLYLVTDAYEGGDLQDAIYTSDLQKLTVSEARPIAAQIILGMQALHSLRIIHRDIKPANILLDKHYNVHIGDFGLACAFGRTYAEQPWLGKPHGYYLLEPERTEAEEGGDAREDTAMRQCGTREYMAPEMCRGDAYSYEVDIWAFGMVVYEMLHGKRPFGLRGPREQVLDSEYRDEIWVRVCVDPVSVDVELGDEARDLLVKILEKDGRKRPSWEQIRDHPWFHGLDWDQLANLTPLPAVESPKDAAFHKELEEKVFGAPPHADVETYPFFQWTSPEFTEFQRTPSPEAHLRVPLRETEPAESAVRVVAPLSRCPPEPLSPAKFPISPIADDETAALASPDARIAMDIDNVIEGMLLVQENPENPTHRNDCFAFDVPRTPLLGFEQSFPEDIKCEDALFEEDDMDTTCFVDVPLLDEDPFCDEQCGEGLLLVNKPPSLSAFYGAFGAVVAGTDTDTPPAHSCSERNLFPDSTAAPDAVETLDGSANEPHSSSFINFALSKNDVFALSIRSSVDNTCASPASYPGVTSTPVSMGGSAPESSSLDNSAVDTFRLSEAASGDDSQASPSGDSSSTIITSTAASLDCSLPQTTPPLTGESLSVTSSSTHLSNREVFIWSTGLDDVSPALSGTRPPVLAAGVSDTSRSWSSPSFSSSISSGSFGFSSSSPALEDLPELPYSRRETTSTSSTSWAATPLGPGEKPTLLGRLRSWWSSLWIRAARRTPTRSADLLV